jgi:hypothetical protein
VCFRLLVALLECVQSALFGSHRRRQRQVHPHRDPPRAPSARSAAGPVRRMMDRADQCARPGRHIAVTARPGPNWARRCRCDGLPARSAVPVTTFPAGCNWGGRFHGSARLWRHARRELGPSCSKPNPAEAGRGRSSTSGRPGSTTRMHPHREHRVRLGYGCRTDTNPRARTSTSKRLLS